MILGIMVIFPVRETLTVTRHLGRVLLCLALRFGQFIRYTGWLEKLCLFCQSFEIPFSFYCALLRKCRNSWQYIYMCYFLGAWTRLKERGEIRRLRKTDSGGLEQVRAPILLPQSLTEKKPSNGQVIGKD